MLMSSPHRRAALYRPERAAAHAAHRVSAERRVACMSIPKGGGVPSPRPSKAALEGILVFVCIELMMRKIEGEEAACFETVLQAVDDTSKMLRVRARRVHPLPGDECAHAGVHEHTQGCSSATRAGPLHP